MKNLEIGEVLINTTKHQGKTNSVGFCFLNADEYEAEEAMHFLSGIVSFGVCAIFETDAKLTESYGMYAKPLEETENTLLDLYNLFMNFHNSFKAKEYCITEYSNKDFKLIKYSEDIFEQWFEHHRSKKNLKWVEV